MPHARTLAALLLSAAACSPAAAQAPVEQGPQNAPDFRPAFEGQTRAPEASSGLELAVETVASGLEHPWGMALLPDGSLLVTERPGRLRVVAPDGNVGEPVEGLPPVHARGQGGLLDVAVSPDFASDRMIYWTYAKPMGDGLSVTAAARGRLAEDLVSVTDVADIFVQEPPSPVDMHYGSRIVFGPDRDLFVTTGEHSRPGQREKAQDLATSYGKVIRIRADGTAPPDNPFVGDDNVLPTIWSLGHRNIQGAAIEPVSGQIWTIEHGPKGGDELNAPRAGLNYGWPVISYGVNYNGSPVGDGATTAADMEQPVYYWDPVIAPSGMVFYTGDRFEGWSGSLLVAALNPGGLHRLTLTADSGGGTPRVTGEERLVTGEGRIRDVEETADGSLLLLTDEEDGRLLRVTPAAPEG